MKGIGFKMGLGLAEFRDDCLEGFKEIVEQELEDRVVFQVPYHHVECRGD